MHTFLKKKKEEEDEEEVYEEWAETTAKQPVSSMKGWLNQNSHLYFVFI